MNRLFNMVKRHLTLPFNFFCFTEDKKDINKEIIIKDLPSINLSGWWYKPYFFEENLFEKDSVNLYMDLDIVIINNIDKLISYNEKKFIGLQDPIRKFNPSKIFLNSSIMRWCPPEHNCLWSNLKNNTNLTTRYKGDQDYIWDVCKNDISFFPDNWILSYKWEVRDRSELTASKPKKFTSIRNPEINPNTSILVFHGSPKIHMVQDKIILDNWI